MYELAPGWGVCMQWVVFVQYCTFRPQYWSFAYVYHYVFCVVNGIDIRVDLKDIVISPGWLWVGNSVIFCGLYWYNCCCRLYWYRLERLGLFCNIASFLISGMETTVSDYWCLWNPKPAGKVKQCLFNRLWTKRLFSVSFLWLFLATESHVRLVREALLFLQSEKQHKNLSILLLEFSPIISTLWCRLGDMVTFRLLLKADQLKTKTAKASMC